MERNEKDSAPSLAFLEEPSPLSLESSASQFMVLALLCICTLCPPYYPSLFDLKLILGGSVALTVHSHEFRRGFF